MIRSLIGTLLLIALFTTNLTASTGSTIAQFNLSINKVFSPQEEVVVHYNQYYSRDEKVATDLQLSLYRFDDASDLLAIVPNQPQQFPIDKLEKLQRIKSWTETSTKNRNRYNGNINLGKMAPGAYLLDCFAWGTAAQIPIIVSEYGIGTRSVGEELYAYVYDQATGKKVQGFEVVSSVNEKQYQPLEEINGLQHFVFETEKGSNYEQPLVIAQKGKSIAVCRNYINRYQQDNNLVAYLFTDRPAYRPGQTINVKGTYREIVKEGYRPYNDTITYILLDSKNTEIIKKALTLDAGGSFTDKIIADEDWQLGEYTISFYKGGIDESNQWRHWQNQQYAAKFRLEEYKKPEYEVKLSFDADQYAFGDEVEVTVKADYFFGAPVTEATVNYRVMIQEYYVPWYRRYPCYWWYEDYYSHYGRSEMIDSGEGVLNEQGELVIKLDGDDQLEARNYKLIVYADVVDNSRRSISGNGQVIVANSAFQIQAHSKSYYNTVDADLVFELSAADFSDRPVETDFVANLIYHGKRWNNKENKKIRKIEGRTSAEGIAEVRLKDIEEPGRYSVEFEAKDKEGRVTKASAWSYIIDPSGDYYRWWQNNNKIQVMTDKKVYESGETVKMMVYAEESADLFVSVNDKHFRYADLCSFENKKDEKGAYKLIEFILDADAYGQQQIMVSYGKDGQQYQGGERFTVIPNHKYLTVELEFAEDRYRPRETATATVRVKDNKGNVVPNAEVALMTADESIYFLYPDKTKDIRKVFYNSHSAYANNRYNDWNWHLQSSKLSSNEMRYRVETLDQRLPRELFLKQGVRFRIGQRKSEDNKQYIEGYIIDHENGNPIPKAKIELNGKSYKADSFGYFKIELKAGTYDVKASGKTQGSTMLPKLWIHKGRTIQLNLSVDNKNRVLNEQADLFKEAMTFTDVDFELDEDGLALEEVQVSGSRRARGGEEMMSADMAAPMTMEAESSGVMRSKNAESKDESNELVAPTVRSDFQDAIYWDPFVITDKNGEAKIKITLPDNLTTWRTTARVITRDTRIGEVRAKIITTKDLLVRMELPRFMNKGDELLIATTVHNYLDTDKEVTLRLTANGLIVEGSEQKINVAANGEQRIDWPVTAPWIREAKLTVEALTDEESDAMELSLPVQPYGLEMVKADAAVSRGEDAASLRFEIPEGVDINTASLKLTADASVAAALVSSLEDLVGYPYGCVEQTMSRFLPTVVVKKALQEMEGDLAIGISDAELQKMVDQGFKRLGELQQQDGGWGWWAHDSAHPYITAYVMNGMSIAATSGLEVDEIVYEKGATALKRLIENKTNEESTTRAYQMMVAMRMGWKKLWDAKEVPGNKAGAYEQSLWLQAAVLAGDLKTARTILARLEDKATRAGSLVYWGDKKFYYRWQDDRVETTANAIRAISVLDPEHELIAPAVQWVMQQRKGNSWHNTRQTAITIFGLLEVIKREINPDLDAELFVNGTRVDNFELNAEGELAMKWKVLPEEFSASTDSKVPEGSHAWLKKGVNTVEFKTKGKGTLYASGQVRYFKDGEQKHIEEDFDPMFEVERNYYGLKLVETKDGRQEYQKTRIDLSDVKSGQEILVKVKIKTDLEQEYVLIEDPIPAGCEFIRDDKSYVIKDEVDYAYGRRGWWYYSWYSHKEFRDDKYTLTVTKLRKGEYEFSYLLRAQIPGEYKISPTVAQLMYYPELRGYGQFYEMTIGD
ncbi:MG2 domain-containing protein [Chitinophagales bacterium]|nr:MG2 domain-containing protein [Chitinophagales bacterium]